MSSLSLPISSLLALFFLVFLTRVPTILSADDPRACRETLTCGSVSSIGYPFWGMNRPSYCGQPGFELRCENNVTEILMNENTLRVLDIDPERQSLKVAREDYWNGYCSTKFINTSIDFDHFNYGSNIRNLTLFYGCNPLPTSTFLPNCSMNSTLIDVSYAVRNMLGDPRYGICREIVVVPVYEAAAKDLEVNPMIMQAALRGGFELQWEADNDQCRRCRDSDGICGYNHSSNSFTCFPTTEEKKDGKSLQLGLGAGSAVAITILICFLVLCFKLGKSLPINHGKKEEDARIEAFIKKFGSLAPRRYSYAEIRKLTNKFNDKLGQGGYGSVYKGKLSDCRLVAVKVLSESKGNGEDFMNEVASISRTAHVNIVSLLGFCFEKSKRALIYEFMPHGSLDGFIYDRGLHHRSCRLEWTTLYDIALGIARGLEYLHQGCNTRILHFDIKPHNILLDENFCPKISDFGLSKLCERKESIISMACARGTIGYIAPEVFCRNFGGVSYKSDVYSYGMMVLEMVGGRKNIDVGVSQTSEVYFPSWIYKHLDQSMNLNLNGGIVEEEEEEMTRKLIIVSLWCIQSDPSDRPSMTKVIEMLQASLQSLIIPLRPFVSSPVRSPKTLELQK
ncbi:LEAF RUST 10 DISEASE-RESISTANCEUS RECEPTOR-LIKE PROTEIN KINASE-like 2.1 isoform X2 [Gossypium hirsutum]|uniref:non-specific serine/threonine protein kinase n=1 Tax=Gossypium hirsutum TaxID=3635 RepID=A0A1U8K2M5_GOSHI|nr:LEAF RUST 10 DISEASE-RESISTANCE LOCUS RECEPTOR-LIKE PROTEIN KINASE-like 2.1 isoform X2 [Gossypium hirsutum]